MKKFGDIYRIVLTNGNHSFMQYICDDSSQLNAPVVFVLHQQFTEGEKFNHDELFKREANGFFAHVLFNVGKRSKTWERISWAPVEIDRSNLVWCLCHYQDFRLESTTRWYCWATGQDTRKPANEMELANAEAGFVTAPEDILGRIETGNYQLKLPRKVFSCT